jgi:predicted metal-dependent HD superfamily phosphohydrolase
MEDFVVDLLKNNLSQYYFYHNYKHTLYVRETAIEIGKFENCTEKELDLLNTAALWHDTGYTKTYVNHEEESCKLARQYLPGYGYSAADIETIIGIIMATKIPQLPKNKLEEILADADLEYLGTNTFKIKADDLFREIQHIKPSLTQADWDRSQISFIQKHHYFTRFCKERREPVKQVYLNELLHEVH